MRPPPSGLQVHCLIPHIFPTFLLAIGLFRKLLAETEAIPYLCSMLVIFSTDPCAEAFVVMALIMCFEYEE
jgi:hypothetical protein